MKCVISIPLSMALGLSCVVLNAQPDRGRSEKAIAEKSVKSDVGEKSKEAKISDRASKEAPVTGKETQKEKNSESKVGKPTADKGSDKSASAKGNEKKAGTERVGKAEREPAGSKLVDTVKERIARNLNDASHFAAGRFDQISPTTKNEVAKALKDRFEGVTRTPEISIGDGKVVWGERRSDGTYQAVFRWEFK